MHASPLAELIDWILSPEAIGMPAVAFVPELARRLREGGLDLVRLHIGGRTMHPEVYAQAVSWTADRTIVSRFPHGAATDEVVQASPVGRLIRDGAAWFRVRMGSPEADTWEITRDLRARGATEYLICALFLGTDRGSNVSFATRRPGGFSEEDVALLVGLVPAIRARVELEQRDAAIAGLLRTYLGGNAARRVLDGAFVRGTGERLRAVVWMSDLRDFTGRTDREPVDRVLADLDAYFTAVAEPIETHGGEVLKFVGDAVLGVFLLGDDPEATCAAALAAARDAFARMDEVNDARAAAGQDALGFGLALHVGEVMYGNIGTRERLDFTVIGRPVNEVSRVQDLCKKLGVPLLVTGAFVRAAGGAGFVSLGRHALRGVQDEPEIFTPVGG